MPLQTPTKTIAELCSSVNVGFVGPSKKVRDSNGVPFLMGKNVGAGYLKLDDLDRVSYDFHTQEKKSKLQPGDVVVVRIGNSGQAAKIPDTLGEANCAGLVIIKGLTGINADYLVEYLNSPTGRNYSLGKAKGSTRATLNTKSVAQTPVPLPPMEVQLKIAEHLAELFEKTTHLADIRAKSDELFSIFTTKLLKQYFSEQNQFEIVHLEANCSLITKGTTPTSVGFKFANSGVNFIKIESIDENGTFLSDKFAHVSPETHEALKRSQLQTGDILVTIAGALGRAAIVTEEILPANTNQAVSLVRFKKDSKLMPEYFLALLKSGFFQVQFDLFSSGAAQQNLSLAQIRQLLVPIPPVEFQVDFIKKVERIEVLTKEQKEISQHQKSEISRLNNSILSSVFEKDIIDV